jgi:ectoine hydroxylase-related dioxygenase (phytanoyl-CoA dioxygenase family)
MNTGDVLVFSNYLIHSREQNQSPANRKALRFVYKTFDNTAIPRGSPIMMCGGMLEYLKNE